jgi:hypothetical protein
MLPWIVRSLVALCVVHTLVKSVPSRAYTHLVVAIDPSRFLSQLLPILLCGIAIFEPTAVGFPTRFLLGCHTVKRKPKYSRWSESERVACIYRITPQKTERVRIRD